MKTIKTEPAKVFGITLGEYIIEYPLEKNISPFLKNNNGREEDVDTDANITFRKSCTEGIIHYNFFGKLCAFIDWLSAFGFLLLVAWMIYAMYDIQHSHLFAGYTQMFLAWMFLSFYMIGIFLREGSWKKEEDIEEQNNLDKSEKTSYLQFIKNVRSIAVSSAPDDECADIAKQLEKELSSDCQNYKEEEANSIFMWKVVLLVTREVTKANSKKVLRTLSLPLLRDIEAVLKNLVINDFWVNEKNLELVSGIKIPKLELDNGLNVLQEVISWKETPQPAQNTKSQRR